MRKILLFTVVLFMAFKINAIEPEKTNTLNPLLSDYNNSYNYKTKYALTTNSEFDLALMNLQVDFLGIVFFGPQVTFDFQFANMFAVGPYVRWHYAGVFYQGMVTDWFSDGSSASLASYSLGVQAKVLIPVGTGQHRPYFELGYEKSRGSDSYDPGGTYGDHIYEYESNVFHFNVGYRLLTESSFNLSAALGIGISKETKNIDYYEIDEGGVDYNTLETRVLPMVQLIMGWQLGK